MESRNYFSLSQGEGGGRERGPVEGNSCAAHHPHEKKNLFNLLRVSKSAPKGNQVEKVGGRGGRKVPHL